jgi:hypothetical protein
VTRPADTTDALLLVSAPRMCVCGHPVDDDQEPRCLLCACQEHKPRLPTAGDHSTPAAPAARAKVRCSQTIRQATQTTTRDNNELTARNGEWTLGASSGDAGRPVRQSVLGQVVVI